MVWYGMVCMVEIASLVVLYFALCLRIKRQVAVAGLHLAAWVALCCNIVWRVCIYVCACMHHRVLDEAAHLLVLRRGCGVVANGFQSVCLFHEKWGGSPEVSQFLVHLIAAVCVCVGGGTGHTFCCIHTTRRVFLDIAGCWSIVRGCVRGYEQPG